MDPSPEPGTVVVVAGDRPTGRLHLGHLVGSLQERLKLQDSHRCFFLVADLHALTTYSDQAAELRASSAGMVLDWMSVGLDPERSTFLLQSAVPEITQLSTILSMFCPVARARRIPALKDTGRPHGHSLGLLGYPVLMAADILILGGTDVPVGEDQVSHLELARELARGFNHKFGPVFREPKPVLSRVPRLVGTDGAHKMSKALDNAIYLSSGPKDVENRVRAMVTDPKRIRSDVPGTVQGNPVFIYHDLFNEDRAQVEDLKSRYRAGRVGDVEVKDRLAQAINRTLEPIRAQRMRLEQGRIDPVEILREGSARARQTAQQNLERIRERVGFLQFRGMTP